MTEESKEASPLVEGKKPKEDKAMFSKDIPKDTLKLLLVVLTSVIAVIIVCYISQKIQRNNWKKNSKNEYPVRATLENFANAAAIQFKSNSDDGPRHYWANGTTDFGDSFRHISNMAGYNFSYFSNGESETEATRYIYTAFPKSWRVGRSAYLIDEKRRLYQWVLNEDDFEQFCMKFSIVCSSINWESSWSEYLGYLRLNNARDWDKPGRLY